MVNLVEKLEKDFTNISFVEMILCHAFEVVVFIVPMEASKGYT